MKIEMGESLFYSWLRHVKDCQIVQTNWKISKSWTLHNEDKIEEIIDETKKIFSGTDYSDLYKKNSIKQLLEQAEVDVLGICVSSLEVYAIDVAFHESGLNYGSKEETISRVIKKFIRTALCILGYFNLTSGEIYFASPKINPNIMNSLVNETQKLNGFFKEKGLKFNFRLIANDEFKDKILADIIKTSESVSDTSELFMRSYQMIKLLVNMRSSKNNSNNEISSSEIKNTGSKFPNRVKDNRIINGDSLQIELSPTDVTAFKKKLIENKRAYIYITYNTGKIEQKIWESHNFTSDSNVMGNLRSRSEFRNGIWQKNGVKSVIVSINKLQ